MSGGTREMKEMEQKDERRRRFFPSISLGSIIASASFIAAAFGVYTQLYADVEKSKVEIVNIKAEAIKLERAADTSRQEIRREIRDVNTKLEKSNEKLDRILEEMLRTRK